MSHQLLNLNLLFNITLNRLSILSVVPVGKALFEHYYNTDTLSRMFINNMIYVLKFVSPSQLVLLCLLEIIFEGFSRHITIKKCAIIKRPVSNYQLKKDQLKKSNLLMSV